MVKRHDHQSTSSQQRQADSLSGQNEQRLSAVATTFVPSSLIPGQQTNGTTAKNEFQSLKQIRASHERKRPERRRNRGRGSTKTQAQSSDTTASRQIQEGPSSTKTVSQDSLEVSGTIRERLEHALLTGIYECCICCDTIKRHQPVFEDQQCWAVFHLSCISKWAKRFMEPESGPQQEFWRCPACNAENNTLPNTYTCWCSKEVRPEVSRLAPHSCSQTCGKRRGDCAHPCLLPCHPGPCPPCINLGPEQRCYCGKNYTQRRCVETDYAAGAWQCKEICDEVLPCDVHRCRRPCHPGLCGVCLVTEDLSCFCGKESGSVPCCDKAEAQTGYSHNGDSITGYWQCNNKCDELFDCQHHKCSRACHARTNQKPSQCPYSPERIKTCHCGRHRLETLSTTRSSCLDPVSSCSETCLRVLPCGHVCQNECHTGSCPDCPIRVDVLCQCGSTQVSTTCQDSQLALQPSCNKTCKSSLSCNRHVCQNQCCTGLPLAQSRVAKRPKGRQAAQAAARYEEIEAEHFCTKICGKPLACGSHSCGIVCHSGPCPTCLVASFDDLVCPCGGTVITAPVACGTTTVDCQLHCTRPKSCGHPPTPHLCHPDNVECARCPYLTEKTCLCTKTKLKNQPCWKVAVVCGQICNNDLPCGRHHCKKRCHLPGDCEAPCTQVCGERRTGCGHPCAAPCHEGQCRQDEFHPCISKVDAMCPCGNFKLSVLCNSKTDDPQNQPDRQLKCTDLCAIVERNKKLSAALGVVPDSKSRVESLVFQESTIEYYQANKIWCTTIEQNLLAFVTSPDKVKSFKPMKADLRQFIHEMAEVYRMRSESFDEEPKRNVQITKTQHTIPPLKSLAQAAATRGGQTPSNLEQMDKSKGQAYNAFVLVSLRFGMTVDELQSASQPFISSTTLEFEFVITDDGEYAFLKPVHAGHTMEEIEIKLARLRFGLRQNTMKADLANTAELCWINKEGKMAYRESKKRGAIKVKKEAPNAVSRNAYDVLQQGQARGDTKFVSEVEENLVAKATADLTSTSSVEATETTD